MTKIDTDGDSQENPDSDDTNDGSDDDDDDGADAHGGTSLGEVADHTDDVYYAEMQATTQKSVVHADDTQHDDNSGCDTYDDSGDADDNGADAHSGASLAEYWKGDTATRFFKGTRALWRKSRVADTGNDYDDVDAIRMITISVLPAPIISWICSCN